MTTRASMKFYNYVGYLLDNAKKRYDKKSIYNDTAIDNFDGVFNACVNASDYCFCNSEIMFEDAIKFSRERRNFYSKTTNYRDYEYYRSYVNAMVRLYRTFKHYKYETYYL